MNTTKAILAAVGTRCRKKTEKEPEKIGIVRNIKKRYRSRVSTFSLTNISLIFFFPSFAPSGDKFYLFSVLSILVPSNGLVPEVKTWWSSGLVVGRVNS